MRSHRQPAAIFIAALCAATASHAAIIVNTIALSGSNTPSQFYTGESFGSTSTSFGTPSINSAGNIAFTAITVGTGAITTTTANGSALQNNSAIYTGNSSLLTLAAHGAAYAPTSAGAATSGANSGQFLTFLNSSSIPAIDNNGNVFTLASLQVYTGSVDSTGTSITSTTSGGHTANNTGLYSATSGTLSLAARNDDAIVGSGPTTYYYKSLNAGSNYSAAVSQSNGQFAEVVSVGTSVASATVSKSGVIQSNTYGSLSIVGLDGDIAPGTGGQPFFSNNSGTVNIKYQMINGSGQVAFVDSVGNATTSNVGIFSQGGGTFHLVSLGGSAAPAAGSPSAAGDLVAASALAFGTIDINNAGQLAFAASLSNNGATGDVTTGVTGNNYALYSETPSNTGGTSSYSLIMRKGDSAPGLANGVVIESTNNPFGSPAINHNGQVAVSALLTGAGIVTTGGTTNSSAIYEYTPGLGTHLLIQSGSTVPGTSGDAFGGFSTYYENANGFVIFNDTLQTGTGGVTTSNNTGIWAVDPDGDIFQIIRKGETGAQFGLPSSSPYYSDYVSSWAAGTVISANSGGEDGRNYGWNDSNTVPLEVYFVTTLGGSTAAGAGEFTVAVPEPASISLIAASLLLLGRRGKRSPANEPA